jgi:hypothetical protein
MEGLRVELARELQDLFLRTVYEPPRRISPTFKSSKYFGAMCGLLLGSVTPHPLSPPPNAVRVSRRPTTVR